VNELLHHARKDFYRANNRPPTLLFVSPEFHTRLCAYFSRRNELWGDKGTIESLVNAKAYGMEIHLVPTLMKGFHVA
jgi:hypothetical protein